MRLKDRVCVITGASSGIGAATARRFAAEGAAVVLGARSEDAVVKVAKDCPGALAKRLDVTDQSSVTAFANAVRDRHGRVDVLVSNAGVGEWGSVEQTTAEQWDRVMDTNLRGAFLVAKAFVPLMVHDRPWLRTIIHTASVAGLEGMANNSAYCASKFGLRGFSLSLAAELAPKGVRVVAVNPGYVATPLVEDASAAPEDMIHPDELAQVYLDLATLPPSAQIDELTVWPRKLYTS